MYAYFALHALIGIALLFAFAQGKRSILWMSGFLLPLAGLVIFVGVAWNWAKLVPVVLLLAVLLHRRRNPLEELPGIMWLGILLMYALLVTMWFFAVDHAVTDKLEMARALGWGPGQTTYRYAVQGFVYLSSWAMLYVSYALVQSREDLDAAIQGFLWGNIFSLSIGMYQSIAQGMGLPWISYDGQLASMLTGNLGVRSRIALFDLGGGVSISRLYGLGGEPKHTAAFAVMALNIVLARSMFPNQQKDTARMLTFLLLGLVMTLSTSGWVGALLVSAILLAWSARLGLSRNASGKPARFVLLVAVGTGVLLSLIAVIDPSSRERLIESRIQERLDPGLTSAQRHEAKDGAYLTMLREYPERSLVGHGVGGADFFIIEYAPREILKSGGTLTPTYLTTRTLADLGLVGAFLTLWLFWAWIAATPVTASGAGKGFLLAGSIAVWLQPAVVFSTYLFLVGAFLGFARSQKRAHV